MVTHPSPQKFIESLISATIWDKSHSLFMLYRNIHPLGFALMLLNYIKLL